MKSEVEIKSAIRNNIIGMVRLTHRNILGLLSEQQQWDYNLFRKSNAVLVWCLEMSESEYEYMYEKIERAYEEEREHE